jgi:hypothetical protein
MAVGDVAACVPHHVEVVEHHVLTPGSSQIRRHRERDHHGEDREEGYFDKSLEAYSNSEEWWNRRVRDLTKGFHGTRTMPRQAHGSDCPMARHPHLSG